MLTTYMLFDEMIYSQRSSTSSLDYFPLLSQSVSQSVSPATASYSSSVLLSPAQSCYCILLQLSPAQSSSVLLLHPTTAQSCSVQLSPAQSCSVLLQLEVDAAVIEPLPQHLPHRHTGSEHSVALRQALLVSGQAHRSLGYHLRGQPATRQQPTPITTTMTTTSTTTSTITTITTTTTTSATTTLNGTNTSKTKKQSPLSEWQ